MIDGWFRWFARCGICRGSSIIDLVDAYLIGIAASAIGPTPPLPNGDPDRSPAQQLKYLWHTLLAHGVEPAANANPPNRHRR